MIVLSGAAIVLPDRILTPGTLVIDGERIAEIRAGGQSGTPSFPFHGHYIVPAFVDVHVHGVAGFDVMDGAGTIGRIAEQLPRFGVAGFCPTTVACAPSALDAVLSEVRALRETRPARTARVLGAHLESNFINPEYAGAQPLECLRGPRGVVTVLPHRDDTRSSANTTGDNFDALAVLRQIQRATPDVAVVTLAPELDGALDLVEWFTARGVRVSMGHSAATYDEASAAIAAGARRATHLFNRMPAFDHRDPGLVGAVLQSDEVAAEIICDSVHVHPAVIRTAIAAKTPARMMAITDGTALAGLPAGSRARLGGQDIVSRGDAAYRADGVLAGSTATMDGVFRTLVEGVGLSLVVAATMCATTPARELGLVGHGVLAADAIADLVVLDAQFAVVQTYIAGQLVYSRGSLEAPRSGAGR
jgi:N-acetylglucosamine-6-phosphate deacetylase